ncbi:hypothetical protein ACVGOW_24410 [Pseudonocardia saturnea]
MLMPQDHLEPVLADQLRALGGGIRFRTAGEQARTLGPAQRRRRTGRGS